MGIFLQLLNISLLHMDDTDLKKYNLSIFRIMFNRINRTSETPQYTIKPLKTLTFSFLFCLFEKNGSDCVSSLDHKLGVKRRHANAG